jgi:hypothetical protein
VQRLPEHDPLVEAICAADGPPALVVSFNPMLEELLAVAALSPQPSAKELVP